MSPLPKPPDFSLVPRAVWIVLLIAACFAPVPFAIVARMRAADSDLPRIHIIQDMDDQGRYDAQQANDLFADGRAMRYPPEGTVAREDPRTIGVVQTGATSAGYVTRVPVPVDEAFVRRGQDRFNIYCAPCHGYAGYGDGRVAQRAAFLEQGVVPPASFHEPPASEREVGSIFNTITHGIRTMPAYGSQVPVEDRWAIATYVRALQISQTGTLADVPADRRGSMPVRQESAP